MLFTDLPLFGALRQRMHWHQGRHSVLAQNVANANTPGYEARDLVKPDFSALVDASDPTAMRPVRTHSAHISVFGASAAADGRPETVSTFETTPVGTTVTLEDEMMKVAQNQMDYRMATTIYSRGMGLLRIALGR